MRSLHSTLLVLAAAASARAQMALVAQLGGQQYVLLPNASRPHLPDQSTLVLNSSGLLLGYQAFSGSYLFIKGDSLDAVLPGAFPPVAVWDLEAAFVDPSETNMIHGFTHHEDTNWEYNGEYRFHGTIKYSLSQDNGMSFHEPAGDAALVYTSAGPVNEGGASNTGTGPHWVIQDEEYLYLYTQDYFAIDPHTNQPTTGWAVARATTESRGVPGSWFKYYRGQWTQPGLGGNATALAGLPGSKIIYHGTLYYFVAVGYDGTVAVSEDGLAWTAMNGTFFPTVPAGHTTPGLTPEYYYYTSLIPGYGNTYLNMDDTLYLYFLYNTPTPESWHNVSRGLGQAEVNMIAVAMETGREVPLSEIRRLGEPIVQAYFALALSSYQLHSSSSSSSSSSNGRVDGSKKDFWATLAPVDENQYDYFDCQGYVVPSLAAVNGQGVQLLDCFDQTTNDHFVARLGECGETPGPSNRPPEVPTSDSLVVLGTIGVIPTQNGAAPVPGYVLYPIYRCYAVADQNHYISVFYECPDQNQYVVQLGYILWPGSGLDQPDSARLPKQFRA